MTISGEKPKFEVPSPDGMSIDAPPRFAEMHRRWWRWHFAGQIAAAGTTARLGNLTRADIKGVVELADALLAELEKEKEGA